MLLHSDGFDSHAAGGTLADGDPSWGTQTAVAVTAAAGRFTGNSLHLAASTTGGVEVIGLSLTYGAVAGWFKVGARTTDQVLLHDGTVALLTLSSTGVLTVKDGVGTTRVTSPTATVADAAWAWLEASWRSDGIYLNVGGAPTGTAYVGAYTAPAWGALELLHGATGNGAVDVDDIIVWDDQGSFFNTFGLAPRRIQLKRPSADGTPVQWLPNGATNWQSVDAADWAGSDGVVATTNGQKDRYQFTALTASPGAVDAVTVKTLVQNTGTDPATLAHMVGIGITESASTPQAVPTSAPGVVKSVFYRDPSSVAWTTATVNSAEFGQTLGV